MEMTAFDLDRKLSDLIGFQCALVALRGVGAEASEEMLWHTLLSSLVEQYGFRRAWFGRIVNCSLRPCVSVPMDDFPVEFQPDSPALRAAALDLPVTVEERLEGRLLIDAAEPVVEERAEQIRILVGEAASMLEERRTRRRNAEALEQAKLRAESADRAKSLMLANMSHEIRTPMTGVMGFADLLASTHLTEDQRDYVDTIRSSANTLLTLINDILDFSKIEAGKLDLESEPVDLHNLVARAVALLSARAAEKGLRLTYNIARAAPAAIIGDFVRLQQVLVNLLGNAVKFTARGEVSVAVTATPQPDGLVQLAFAVSDTGPGIAAEHRDRIFDSFSQVDGSISRKFGGTGLGLAISRSLVRQMGGAISLESQLGSGSTFRFWIPAAPVVNSQPAASHDILSQPETAALPPMRILIAEDNPLNRKLLLTILQRLGLHADVAANGLEVLDRVASTDYDVVLMDVQMPEMDGLAATARIRAEIPPGCQPTILAMTAAAFPEDRVRCLEAGMDEYLSKPVDLPQLVTALRRVAERSPAPASR